MKVDDIKKDKQEGRQFAECSIGEGMEKEEANDLESDTSKYD